MRLHAPKALFFVVLLVMGLGWTPPAGSVSGERHAGTVLALDTEARTLVIDELGANAIRRSLQVRLAPRALVVRSERNRGAEAFDRPFEDTAIGFADVRIGDFVVVELAGQAPHTAAFIVVTFRSVSESGT